jgi:hypothetical protein
LITDNGIVKEDLKLYRNVGLDVRVSN